MRKRNIYSVLFFIMCGILLFISCKGNKEEYIVKKVVEDFYTYINKKDFQNLRSISSDRVEQYLDIIERLEDDLIQVRKIDVLEIDIDSSVAVVRMRVDDIYGYTIVNKMYLVKDGNGWLIDDIELEKNYKERVLSNKDIEYSKKSQPKKEELNNDNSKKINTQSDNSKTK